MKVEVELAQASVEVELAQASACADRRAAEAIVAELGVASPVGARTGTGSWRGVG